MPKRSPDQTIRHEVVLGRAEREIVRNTLESLQFKNYSTPIVAGLSDVTFTLTIATILGIGLGGSLDRSGIDPNWREIIKDMTPDQVKDWFETQNIVGGGIGFIIGALLGGPIGAGIGAVGGSAVVEGLEYAERETKELGSEWYASLANLHQRILDWAGVPDQSGGGGVF